MTNKDLMKLARLSADFAYAPYSNYSVGAALLIADGSIYTGCNIENASYGATNCSERTAVFKAVSEGKLQMEKIAVVASDGSTAYPCGICLQVLNEFMPEGIVVLEEDGNIVEYSLKERLPMGFQLSKV